MMSFYQWQGEQLYLWVQVQPRASQDAIVGEYAGRLKIRITAPPIDGKANAHLTKFLAKTFGVPQKQVRLLSGETCKEKRFVIQTPKKLPMDIEAKT